MTDQKYGPVRDHTTLTDQTAKPDILSRDFSQFLSPAPDGQASTALQKAMAMTLLSLEVDCIQLIQDEATHPVTLGMAQTVIALLDCWYVEVPWALSHPLALEQYKTLLIMEYFIGQLTIGLIDKTICTSNPAPTHD